MATATRVLSIPEQTRNGEPQNGTTEKSSDDAIQTGSSMGTHRRHIVMFSLCLALFLSALDVTIVSTALPTMARHLDANAAQYAWIGSCYTLANTSSVAIWAKLSDIFGRKPIIMLANGGFLAGSLISGIANSVGMLIGGRILQGISAGGCSIMVTIVISDLFPLRDRAKYYGLTGIVYAIASSIGPVLGGVFTQTISWRWCFFINLPFCGSSLVVLFFALKVHNPRTPIIAGLMSLDWIGSFLIVGGTICFLCGLETGAGAADSWRSAKVICLIVFGIAILLLFGAYEQRFAKNPLVPIRIFSRRTNIASFLVICLDGLVFIAFDYFLPLYFQVALHFSPIISGVSLLAMVLPLSAATMGSGFYVKKTQDYILPLWAGSLLMTLGTGLLIDLGATTNWAKIILFLGVAGFGAGPLFQCPMIAFQSHLPQKDIAAASSVSMFLRSLSSSASIIVGSVLLQSKLGSTVITVETDSPASAAKYVSAMKVMWIFYTAMSGLMTLVNVFIEKMPAQAHAEPHVESAASESPSLAGLANNSKPPTVETHVESTAALESPGLTDTGEESPVLTESSDKGEPRAPDGHDTQEEKRASEP